MMTPIEKYFLQFTVFAIFALLQTTRLDAQTWKSVHPTDSSVTALAISPDGSRLMVATQEGPFSLDSHTLGSKVAISSKVRQLHDLSFSMDKRSLFLAGGTPSETGMVEEIRWPQGDLLEVDSTHGDSVQKISVNENGDWVSASWDSSCRVHRQNQLPIEYRGHTGPVLAVEWLPNNTTILSAGIDQTIQVWNGEDGKTIRTMDNHTGTVLAISVRPGEEWTKTPWCASTSEDRTLRFWQPTVGRMVRFLKLPSLARSIAWLPDGSRLIAGCDDGQVRLVDPQSLAMEEWKLPEEIGRPFALVVSPRGDRVYLGGSRGVGLFQR